jgi:hypothetical protein
MQPVSAEHLPHQFPRSIPSVLIVPPASYRRFAMSPADDNLLFLGQQLEAISVEMQEINRWREEIEEPEAEANRWVAHGGRGAL